jgi:hypothetical protein
MPTVPLKCNGDSGTFNVQKKPDTVTFKTAGKCTLTTFGFVPKDNPPGFQRGAANPDGSIPYSYDGSPIPSTGYAFAYVTSDQKVLGNGTGVIKN